MSGNAPDVAVIGKILQLWGEGFSAGKIAVKLGATRNSVMGRVYRAQRDGQAERRHVVAAGRGEKSFTEQAVANARKAGAFVRWLRKHTGNNPQNLKVPDSVLLGRKRQIPQQCPTNVPLPLLELSLPSGNVLFWHQPNGCCYITNDDVSRPQWCNAQVEWGAWCEFHRKRAFMAIRRPGINTATLQR